MAEFRQWPERMRAQTPDELRALYDRGYRGAYRDPEQKEILDSELEYPSFGAVCDDLGLWRTDPGDLLLPFLHVVRAEAERLGIQGDIATLSQDERIEPWDERQETGDCVSHWARNHYDVTRAAEIYDDGEPEGWHVRTATEIIYGARGHSGEGANCDRLARFLISGGGGLLRQVHDVPGYGRLDLSRYSPNIGIRMGGSGVPKAIADYARANALGSGTRITSIEEAVAAFRNGRCIGGCSGQGFSSTRNDDGVSEASGSWAHATYQGGMDARPETVRKYGGRLFLYQNSWGPWNRGPRLIRGTNIAIPVGSMWIRERVMANMIAGGGIYTMAGVKGWAPLRLPDMGATGVI